MAQENFANFATTALVLPNPLPTSAGNGATFTVTANQGVLFPTANFLVTMDTEVILIGARSGDTFTISTRGFDNSTTASHNAGAIVQNAICAYDLRHLWGNVSDTFNPVVPPGQTGLVGSGYDNEFESSGPNANATWVLVPTPAGNTLFNAGTSLFSQLVFNRDTSDHAVYTAYVPISITSGSFSVTTCVSDATNSLVGNTTNQTQLLFFASDQGNPSSGADTGNRFRVDVVTNPSASSSASPLRAVRASADVAGAFNSLSAYFPIAINTPVYLRMYYDGNGNWSAYVGDGYTYRILATKTNFLSSPVTLGFSFALFPQATILAQTVAIDFLRLVLNPNVQQLTFGR